MKCASILTMASLIVAFPFVLVSCSKDSNTTKPQLSIKSINSTDIPLNGTLDIILQFSSKKGNLGGGHFYAHRQRLNQSFVDTTTTNSNDFSGIIPSFSGTSKGEFEFTADYGPLFQQNNDPAENDTLEFKFAAMTVDSVWSDTITSPKIIVRAQ